MSAEEGKQDLQEGPGEEAGLKTKARIGRGGKQEGNLD